MFDSSLQPAGRNYTVTAALLSAAVLFIPALIAVSQPVSYLFLSAGIAGSALCVTLACVHWKRFAKASASSLGDQGGAK